MTTLDIILLVLIGIGAVLGFMKGFLRQLAGLLGLVAGVVGGQGPVWAVGGGGVLPGEGHKGAVVF